MKRRRLLTALIALADALALPAFAQPAWPTRLVKIVVPAPACSSLDLIVRAMSDKLGARWGQPVVMENQPGAGGKVNCSSLGKGSSAHLTMELFLSEAGITATHIPFNGSPPAAMAGAQGEADATFMVAPALHAHVRNNKVRLLAASSAQRPDSQKDLPTLADAGYSGVESLAWNGLLAPAGAPDTVVSRINAESTTC